MINININGIKTKEDTIVDLLVKQKIHLATITELHKYSSHFPQDLKDKNYKLLVNPTTGNSWNGTAFIVHESITSGNHYSFNKIIKGRLSKLKITLLDKIYHVYCAYLSSGNGTENINQRLSQLKKLKESLAMIPFNEKNIIIAGDFNFIESDLDTVNRFSRGPEARAMEEIKRLNDIEDVYRKLNPKGRQITYIKDTAMRRIDRIYMSNPIKKSLLTHDFMTIPRSDHKFAPVLNIRKKEKIRWGRGKWKLNITLLNKENHDECKRIWDFLQKKKILYDNVLDWWDDAKTKLRKFFIRKGIEKRKQEKNQLKKLAEMLGSIHLMATLSTEEKKRKVAQINAELTKLTNYRTKGQKLRSKVLDFENEEENHTDFYKLEEMHANRKELTELEVNKTKIVGKDNIMEAVHKFWNDLWGERKTFNEEEQTRYLEKYLKDENKARAAQSFVVLPEETLKSLKNQNKKGSPGSDGYPPDFYEWAWDFIQYDLTEVINNCYLNGEMSKSMRAAIVTLIPKNGKSKILKDWRPVSLLNVDYKIIAKIITERLKSEIENEISREQKCAIKGRQISDIHLNILASLKKAKKINHPSIIACYDYTKAFDMIDHSIIWKTLDLLKASKTTINWIKVMYKNITSQIQVNGALTKEIRVVRGIRQGCPLSMLLFVIALESLSRSLKQDRNIKAPYDDMVVQQYADDLTTITSDTASHLLARKHIQKFCKESGLELNLGKTKIIHRNLSPDEETNLKSISPDNTIENRIKILGIFFNDTTILDPKNWDERIEKMRKIIMKHNKRDISIFGKVKLINTLILPHLNVVGRIQKITTIQIKKINSLIFPFLWFPRKIEQCSREKVTCLKKNGGLGIPDIKSRCNALFVSRLASIVGALPHEITEPWHRDALEQIGTRILRITPSLYSNRRLNADAPDAQYKTILETHDSIEQENFVWKKAKVKSIYHTMNDNQQTTVTWPEILLQDDKTKAFFTNTEREIAWRTTHNAYKWEKFKNRNHTQYSFIPGFDTISSQHCVICNSDEDTIEHLLTRCTHVREIWCKINTVVNTLTSRRFVFDNNQILRNTVPQDEERASWLIPLKAINIVKVNLIFWHDSLALAKAVKGPINLWIKRITTEAEKDIKSFIANLVSIKGNTAYQKYHIKR